MDMRLDRLILFLLLIPGSSFIAAQPSLENTRNCQEQILLQSDRDIYIAGETLFFRMHYFNGEENHNGSQIVNVILRDTTGTNVHQLSGRLQDDAYYSSIYLEDTLRTGYYQLLAFTNQMRALSSACYGSSEVLIVNRFDRIIPQIQQEIESLNGGETSQNHINGGEDYPIEDKSLQKEVPKFEVSITEAVAGVQQKIGVSVEIHDKSLHDADFSVAVVPKRSLFAQNWSDTWEPIKEDNKIPGEDLLHLSEISGFILSGRIGNGSQSMGGRKILLSVRDSVANLKYATTRENGLFYFHLNDYYLGKRVFLRLHNAGENDNEARIIIDNRYLPLATGFQTSGKDFFPYTRDYVLETQNYVRVEKAFEQQTKMDVKPNNLSGFLHKLYSYPDYRVYPDEFEALDDFVEISRELLHVVRLRRPAGTYSVRLLDARADFSYLPGAPLVFVDGVLTPALDGLIPMDSEKIKMIDIVNRKWALGDLAADGVLSVTLAEDADFIQPEGLIPFDTPLLTPERKATIPDAAICDNSIHPYPDFRRLLFWEPRVKRQKGEHNMEFSFITSHVEEDYRIVVTAFTPLGEMVRVYEDFSVKVSLK